MAYVELMEVKKEFGRKERVQALSNFSLDISAGELVAILGPSGCGKSTLLRCVAGLEEPDGGQIRIADRVVNDEHTFVPPEGRGVGMVFQSYALWPHMTVYENVEFPLRVRKGERSSRSARIEAALGTVGMAGMERRLPSELSGGQQQRVALARAIVADPRLLLFDEPLSNLDTRLREAMRVEIRRLHEEGAWTALYVTHDRLEAMYLADRIVVLRDGVVQQIGEPLELYRRPINSFVAAFLGDIVFVRAKVGPRGAVVPDIGRSHGLLEEERSGLRALEGCMGLRPDALTVSAIDNGQGLDGLELEADDEGTFRTEGEIVRSTDFGAYTEYEVMVGNDRLVAHAAGSARLTHGDRTLVEVDLDQTLAFGVEGTRELID